MDIDTNRRRFLELAGTGTALSIAGCNALDSTETTASTTNTDSTATDDGAADDGEGNTDRTAALQVQPDQEELKTQQEQVSSKLQSGELSRREAQQEMQSIRQTLLADARASFEGRLEDESSLGIDDSLDQFGVYLVSGSAGTLIDSLSYSEVGSMFARETFEEAKSQTQQQTATPSG